MRGLSQTGAACQLCGRADLERYDVPGVASYLLCRDCMLYQYGPVSAGSPDYDPDIHSYYESRRERKLRTAVVRLNRVAPLVSGKDVRLLDVGCGTGATLEAAGRRGWRATGVDISEKIVLRCREAGCDSHVAEDHDLPFDDGTFDAVTAWSVIEHVADVRASLAEWRRVLRPGGLLAIDTSDALCWKTRLLGAGYRRFWSPHHSYVFTPENLRGFLEQAGFETLRPPFVGRLRDLPPGMALHALGYQAQFELKQALRLQKTFQLFARRSAQ
jgi:ubiquinone/menaquinone biosynthesis C-methylase UbiE